MKSSASSNSVCPLCRSNGSFSFASNDLMFCGRETYNYHECRDCGAVYQYPMPDADMIASFYPDNYRIYDANARIKKRGRLEKAVLRQKYRYQHLEAPSFFRLISPIVGLFTYNNATQYTPNGRALDVGCGNGHRLQRLKEIGWHCEGVEFNLTAVDICRSQGLKVHHGDLQSAGFDDSSFNLITAFHVVEHFPDPDSFMEEAVRILKHDGKLLVKTPNSRALGRKWFGKYWYANEAPRHLILYSPDNLDMLATRHGLRRIAIRLNTTPKIILNSIDYKTGNRGKPSKKISWRRLLAKIYVLMAKLSGRGDEIYVIYGKA